MKTESTYLDAPNSFKVQRRTATTWVPAYSWTQGVCFRIECPSAHVRVSLLGAKKSSRRLLGAPTSQAAVRLELAASLCCPPSSTGLGTPPCAGPQHGNVRAEALH